MLYVVPLENFLITVEWVLGSLSTAKWWGWSFYSREEKMYLEEWLIF